MIVNRATIFFLGLIFLIFTGCKTQKSVGESNDTILESIKRDVETLAADNMEGRKVGTEGEKKAALYISKRMEELGLIPGGEFDSYYQIFSHRLKANPQSNKTSRNDKVIRGYNVIGSINNEAQYTAIIGAHFDHLGFGSDESLTMGESKIHNGADDNASGVAGMLRIAEELKNESDKSLNYIFIAFSGKEEGLWGSNYFTKNPTINKKEINYMINLDMIGRLNEEKQLTIYGTGTTPLWKRALASETSGAFNITKEESGLGDSDHTSFYLENLPVLHFFTGEHEDYHIPSDDAHLINYRGIVDITDYILDVIEFTKKRGKLQFTKTKDSSSDTPGYEATLGIIPDYLYDGRGMRIDGIKERQPASKANLKKGDIVIKMGNLEIFDMISFRNAIDTFEKGQIIDLTIIRNGKENTRKLTL
ncbi:MAG: M20/M25/M40 family metallo-hydrolase [Bacteroidota bacterium]